MTPFGMARFRMPAFLRKVSAAGIWGVAFALASVGTLRADEFSQVSHYSVPMSSYRLLSINTRMGDIRIEGWDKPEMVIEAQKVVRAGSEQKASKLYDRLKIDIQGKEKTVFLRAIYPPRRPWRPFRGESRLSVNFRIRMPSDTDLELKCVDGDIRISGMIGYQYVRLNYGDVEIDLPSVDQLRSIRAKAWLGYVQSDLHREDGVGFGPRVLYWNPSGDQDIDVRVRMGGIFIYKNP
jgi:hypothetical protein